MYHYDPLVLGFVLNLELQFLERSKAQLVEVVRRLESDDRGYIYHPSNVKILQHSGPVVASISNYQHPRDFDLEVAIKQTILSMATQDVDAKKHVFVVLDQYENGQSHRVKQSLNLDIKMDCGCIFTFLGIGNRYDPEISRVTEWHPRCKFVSLENPDLLAEKIIAIAEVREIALIWKKQLNAG
jgi:hypothetical protein